MADLTMLVTYSGRFTPEEVTRYLHVMAQARESLPVLTIVLRYQQYLASVTRGMTKSVVMIEDPDDGSLVSESGFIVF